MGMAVISLLLAGLPAALAGAILGAAKHADRSRRVALVLRLWIPAAAAVAWAAWIR